MPLLLFNHDTRYIIDDDGEEKNENVNGNKEHVKKTTGCQQKEPPEIMWS
jgi:hypothetical protein